jgi:hypothetical protein
MAQIQIHRAGRVTASAADIEPLAREFQQKDVLLLENFLEPELLRQVQTAIADAEFQPRHHGDIKLELCMTREGLALHMLMLLANSPAMLRLMERISGAGPLGSYVGRIYRFPPGPEYFDNWHDDLGDGRQVAMSVNLSSEVYEGGLLEVREGERVICRLANTTPGGALLFRIREGLKHHITTVTGNAPKTAFAGWFIDVPHSEPYLELIRGEERT